MLASERYYQRKGFGIVCDDCRSPIRYGRFEVYDCPVNFIKLRLCRDCLDRRSTMEVPRGK